MAVVEAMTDMPSEKSLPISRASYDRARKMLKQRDDNGRTRMETWDEFFNRLMDALEALDALENKKPAKRPARVPALTPTQS